MTTQPHGPTWRIQCPDSGTDAVVTPGTDLLSAARAAGVVVDAPCNGSGTCGKCLVQIVSGDAGELTAQERDFLSVEQIELGVRLACECYPLTDVQVAVGAGHREPSAVLGGGVTKQVTFDPAPAAPAPNLGAAVDIGTTTIAVGLFALGSGEELGSATALNAQVAYGHDVLTRVRHAAEPSGLSELVDAARTSVGEALERALTDAGVSARELGAIVVAANTVMTHLVLGIDPSSLGRAPYTPKDPAPQPVLAADLGWPAAPGALASFVPAISAFVGGDIVAGLLATGLAEGEAIELLVDMGTNGEIVLGSRAGLWACSAAAGPAFEGMGISSGMRAAPGAIERVLVVDGDVRIETIAGEPAVGLCGSGVIDGAAALLGIGAVGASGRLQAPSPDAAWASRWRDDPKRVVLSDPGAEPEVAVNQKDIRQIQLAKGAVASGISALLDESGIAAEQIETVWIAGQFGHHVRHASLASLGLVPPELVDRIAVAGNTSRSGAALCLLSAEQAELARTLATDVVNVELSTRPGFDRLLADAMAFPKL